MKRLRSFEPPTEAVKEVQKTGDDVADVAGAVVPQDMVDFPEGAQVVAAGPAITGLQALGGVGVEERQASVGRSSRRRHRRFQGAGGNERGGGRQPPAKEPAAVDGRDWNHMLVDGRRERQNAAFPPFQFAREALLQMDAFCNRMTKRHLQRGGSRQARLTPSRS